MTTHNHPIYIFGEVLFDHFPDGSRVLGGAPFNVAWHLQALGQAPCFISRIGGDPEGNEISGFMTAWGMNRRTLQTDPAHPTGSVRITIEHGEPRFDVVDQCAYDFIGQEPLALPTTEGVLYHGSLAARNPVSRATLNRLKAAHRGKIFVDVNLRPPWWQPEFLLTLLNGAHWIKLNEAELDMLCPGHRDLETAMRDFFARFDPEILIVTRGGQGAVACDRLHRLTSVRPAGGITVVDTVGAGDAFAAVLLLGLVEQWPLRTALERAQAFAGALVGRRGATVEDPTFYRPFIEQWNLSKNVSDY
ncbi:carbohydrate kinase family protein [Methylosarcina fibrata]|uniref:carbohydrate kinase family protein n=1 Tax=Methylosarcina fibrata TaxID=105972 RepID=UPI000371CCDE|nr:carbohydrate kinase [Methylosarcina fibrata]